MWQPKLFYSRQICIPFLDLSRGSLHRYGICESSPLLEEHSMSNQRRQFMALAAGAIAVPATSNLVLAQGNASRGREAPIPAPVPERRPAKSELTGLSA